MKIQLKVMTAVVNSRVAKTGEDKGQVKYSVDFYAYGEDMIPSKLVAYGLTEHEARSLANQYSAGTDFVVNYVPRDAMFVNPQDLAPAILKGGK